MANDETYVDIYGTEHKVVKAATAKKSQQKPKKTERERYDAAMARWYKKVNSYVIKKARAYLSEIAKKRRYAAMEQTMRLTQFSRAKRLELSRTKEYMGSDYKEILPEREPNESYSKYEPYINEYGDVGMLNEWYSEAVNETRMPKILEKISNNTDPVSEPIQKLPDWMDARKYGSKGKLGRLNKKDKYKNIKV
jgi:hypothetical protein